MAIPEGISALADGNCTMHGVITSTVMAFSCRYVAMQALQAGNVPAVLISGGSGHSTVHLYNSIRRHPVWHPISTQEGRYEAEVNRGSCTGMTNPRRIKHKCFTPGTQAGASAAARYSPTSPKYAGLHLVLAADL